MTPAESRVLTAARALGAAMAGYSSALEQWRAAYPDERHATDDSHAPGWDRIVYPALSAMIDARIESENAARALYDGAGTAYAGRAPDVCLQCGEHVAYSGGRFCGAACCAEYEMSHRGAR